MNRFTSQALILTLLAFAGRVAGQTESAPPQDPEGPVIVGTPRETWKTLELIHLESALEFRWQYQRDKLRQRGQDDQTNREVRYRELLDLSGEMAIGHRNLVDINGAVQLGLENISTKNSVDNFNGDESDFVNLWDVNALILGTSAAPTNVFARREQSLLDRPFAGTVEETVTEEGIGTRLLSSWASASFEYRHRESELTGDFGNINSNVVLDTLTMQSAFILTPTQRLEVSYTFDMIDESQAGGYADAYNRHDASVVHTYTFGEEARPDELRSSLRLYNQSGAQSQDHLRLDETLTLHHTDRLESRYGVALDTQNVRGSSQDLARGEASLRHRLFESLTSVGTVGAQHLSAGEEFTSDELFINGQLDYTKRVPYGRFDAAAGIGLNSQSNSERGSTLSVFDESYTFNDGFPIILSRRNIVPGSVLVKPVAGFPVFQEGIDYTLDIFIDHAEIRGVVGGGFVNGQTVLVSYDIGPEPGSDIETTTGTLSVRYSITEGWLDGVALYSTYRTVGHNVKTDDPTTFVLDDVNDLLLGVEYRLAELDLSYEYNNHDSTFDPYTVHRLQALYVLPLGIASSFSADLTREVIDFTRQDNQVTFDRASLRWDYRLNSSLDLNARIEYRDENSSANGESQGFDQSLGFTWHKRQTSVYCSFRNSMLEGPNSEQESQFLQFGVRRAF